MNTNPSATPSPTGPVRFGVVGLGQRTFTHSFDKELARARELMPGLFEVTAACDSCPEHVERARRSLFTSLDMSPRYFEDLSAMLDAKLVDAVYLATPNDLHCKQVLQCFEAGVDVLCEKPIAVTLADADRMIAAATASGRVLGMGMQMHYRVRYHRAAEIIRSGRIGVPVMAWCIEVREPFDEARSWVFDDKRSGGAIVEKNCHHADILELLTGGRPTVVHAVGGQAKYQRIYGIDSQIIDHAWVHWQCDNGVKAMIGLSLMNEGIHEREFGVVCTEGVLSFSLRDDEVLHLRTRSGQTEDIACPGTLRGDLFADFLSCVRTRQSPLVSADMGRRSLLVPLAAERSIRESRPVHVAELENPA